jgi:hypothetical protein
VNNGAVSYVSILHGPAAPKQPKQGALRRRAGLGGETMTLWQKLFSRKAEPRQRIRVCIECGMPIAEHKDWCSILRTQRELEQKAAAEARKAT